MWPPNAPSPSALPKLYPSNSTVSDIILAASVPSSEHLTLAERPGRTRSDGGGSAFGGPAVVQEKSAAAAAAAASLGWRARDDTNYSPSNWRFRGHARPRLGSPSKRMLMHFLGVDQRTTGSASADANVNGGSTVPQAALVTDPSPSRTEESDNTLVHHGARSAQPKESTAGDSLLVSGDNVISEAISVARSPIWKGVRRFRTPSHSLEEGVVV